MVLQRVQSKNEKEEMIAVILLLLAVVVVVVAEAFFYIKPRVVQPTQVVIIQTLRLSLSASLSSRMDSLS